MRSFSDFDPIKKGKKTRQEKYFTLKPVMDRKRRWKATSPPPPTPPSLPADLSWWEERERERERKRKNARSIKTRKKERKKERRKKRKIRKFWAVFVCAFCWTHYIYIDLR